MPTILRVIILGLARYHSTACQNHLIISDLGFFRDGYGARVKLHTAHARLARQGIRFVRQNSFKSIDCECYTNIRFGKVRMRSIQMLCIIKGMSVKITTIVLIIITVFISSQLFASSKTKIDLVPMYGGIDRNTIPELKVGDEKFISDVVKQFGTRESAAQAWIDQGFKFYSRDLLDMAMKRFNQAWLLNPNNPEVFHGFSTVLYDQGDNCGAMKMTDKAIAIGTESLGLSEPGFLADAALISSLCAISKGTSANDKFLFNNKADQLFLKAEKIIATAYLYDKWWQALYWRAEYDIAWDKVFLMREKGRLPEPSFLKHLRRKMPEPRR